MSRDGPDAARVARRRTDRGARAKVTLRMSQAVHSGHSISLRSARLTSSCSRVGPAWSRVVGWSTRPTPARSWSARKRRRCCRTGAWATEGPGRLALREPAGDCDKVPLSARPDDADGDACALPVARGPRARHGRRRHPRASSGHDRLYAFRRTDALIEQRGRGGRRGAPSAGERRGSRHRGAGCRVPCLRRRRRRRQADPDRRRAEVTGDDEERMLLALRKIVDADLPIPDPHRRQPRRRSSPATSDRSTAARTR